MADDGTEDQQPQQAPPQVAPPQQTPQIDTSAQTSTATIPDAQAPQQQAPTVLVPQRKGGLAGIVQEFKDAVGGQTSPQTYIDPNTGDRYVQHPYLTGRQQWMRIGATALRGAAAGLAHGQGPGGGERAAAAGIQTGMDQPQKEAQQQNEQADADYQRQRQAKLDNAADQINTAKLVSNQFALTRMQAKAGQEDIDWSDKREADLRAQPGTRFVGTAANVNDLARIQREDEADLLKNHFSNNTYVTVPKYGEDGKANGIAIYAKAPGYGDQLAPQGTTIPIFQAPAKPGEKPTRKDVTPTVPLTNSQVQGYANQYDAQMTAWQKQQADNAYKVEQTRNLQSEEVEHRTAGTRNIAEAGHANAETENTRVKTANLQNQGSEEGIDPSANAIASGHVTPERMSYLLARNPKLIDDVLKVDPKFDSSKAESYPATYKDFTSGKTSVQLNAGGTALGHLSELQHLNTVESHIPGTPAYTRYQNKADTVAVELAKFYGDATIPGIASIKKTLTSTLPGTRNAAITTQAQSMGDKLDSFEQTWKNAAPSSVYQAPMPGISQKAMDARAALDPAYRERRVNEAQQNPQSMRQPPARPTNVPPAATWNDQGNNGRGAWELHQ